MSGPRKGARALLSLGAVVVLAGGLLAAGAAFGGPTGDPGDSPSQAPAAVSASSPTSPDALAAGITRLQEELKRVPANDQAWAELGAGYVQQARITADPTLYGKADGAFAESLRLRPEANDAALAGQASLEAARHEFAKAVQLCDQALQVNPYSSAALAVKVDGLIELGRYADSRTVLDKLLRIRPGVDSFSRASYALELQGDVDGARAALERALGTAQAPADQAFVQHYLGELAWNSGDVDTAARSYDAALAADPAYVPPLAGKARAEAARGDVEAALTDYRAAVARQPQPATLVELGELLEASGRTAEADQQYAVVRATQQLYASSGQVVDAELSLFEADHGDPAEAVRLAERAYAARPKSIIVQDAYAWALHAAGRDREALPLARAAVRTGLHSASLSYHLGVVEQAVGHTPAARKALSRALELNPAWNPLNAPRARALLDSLS